MVSQVGYGGGKPAALMDGVFIDTDHERGRVVESFFDFALEAFVDAAFHGAW